MPTGIPANFIHDPVERFWSKVGKTKKCWEWVSVKPGRRGKFYRNGMVPMLAHRYAWELVNGPIPKGLFVCHKCDNPRCVRPSHLFLGTQTDNMRDCANKGRHGTVTHPEAILRGNDHPAHKKPWAFPRGDSHYSRTTPERLSRGEGHYMTKLTEKDVREIRKLAAEGTNISQIAQMFGIGRASASHIVHRRNWKHI